jgi:hypothetical protein
MFALLVIMKCLIDEYEESLELCVDYVCGSCNHEGKTKIPFKRKTFMGVKSFIFECDKCKVKYLSLRR